jgi:glutathione S-transferase
MAITLYENSFSPFARKVRLVLEHKGVEHEVVDGLARKNRERLERVNGRVEVPALVHDDLVLVNSPDIVAYLERRFPDKPSVYPSDHAAWARARAWERCADTVVDSILVDISYWSWAKRPDRMPDGLLEAARRDLNRVYDALERDLGASSSSGDFLCGAALSIADLALFPHLTSARLLDVSFDASRYPKCLAWYKRLRALDICVRDLDRTKAYIGNLPGLDLELDKIFWRGDRIEWILARGYHKWFMKEIEEGRVMWPGLGIPNA